MHIFFSGIGGAGIGPLAQIAHQAGLEVSGSDKQSSNYIDYLKKHGITDIHIGQSKDQIAKLNNKQPIDWCVYSSAVAIEQPNSPEIEYCRENSIKVSKRDELINFIVSEKKLKLIAVAGTHGKTTTTAMVVWLFKQLGLNLTYLLPAKTSFGQMGEYDAKSEYFVVEADEFDRNFLSFEPYISLITGVSWDHHEIFPTREDYQLAFKEFISQSNHTLIWQDDAQYLGVEESDGVTALSPQLDEINNIKLFGQYNRLDAFLAVSGISKLTKVNTSKLIELANKFPGLSRRMEEIIPNLYSDYAHTPEKIRGAISVASELASSKNQDVVVIYEPLTDRRQHYILDNYGDSFNGVKIVYWLPSYLAREDPNQKVLAPEEIIEHLVDPAIAKPTTREELPEIIKKHLKDGDMIVCLNGGGGGGLDEWLRENAKGLVG